MRILARNRNVMSEAKRDFVAAMCVGSFFGFVEARILA